ncbi:MAG: HD domain-containing protein [Dehalococcoidia bacterium]|nr:HD domain-containing protein [Dehalococcoidia bacterium]
MAAAPTRRAGRAPAVNVMTSPADVRGTAIGAMLERARVFLAKRQVAAWTVGGSVRDMLLGVPTADADLVVDAPNVPELGRQFADEIGGAFYHLDQQRNYVRVLSEPDAAGERARLDITPLGDQDIASELSRRDFTVNAIALPLETWHAPDGNLIDPLDGCADLNRRVLRAVKPAIYADDGIRLMRLVRLAGQLGFTVDDETQALAKRDASHIADVSPDRLRDELCKVLALRDVKSALRLLDDIGLLSRVMPELDAARGVTQPIEHYWDVFDHLVETVGYMDGLLDENRRAADPILAQMPWSEHVADYFAEEVSGGVDRAVLTKLACLLHDISKPQTKTVEESGRTRFLGHPEQGAEVTETVMERLHFSRRANAYVSLLVRQHLRPMQLSNNLETPTRRALYRFKRDLGDASVGAVWLAMADFLAAKGPMLDPNEWRRRVSHCSLVMESILAEPADDMAPPQLVNGHRLMEALGVGPGPRVGQILEAVREALAADEVSTPEEALEFARREWETRFGSLGG